MWKWGRVLPSLARILEARGYAGWKIGGYSIYILGGLFRFVRLLRFERFCVMRYGENGAPGALQQYINGPFVRFYMLILKVGSTICAAAAIVCMAEYPCVERSEKLEDDLQLADCNARFRHYQDCVYFLIVTFSTVGYGDMYPATRLGKGVVVFVLLFVLCFLPSLLSDIAELSDGDDTSAEEQQINAVAALHEAVLDLHEDVEHLAAGFEALGALAGRGEAKQVASHLGAVQERQDHDAKMRHEVLMAALRKVERRLADGGAGGRRRPDVVEEDGDAPPPPREASPARLAHGSKLRRGKRRRLPAVRSPGATSSCPRRRRASEGDSPVYDNFEHG